VEGALAGALCAAAFAPAGGAALPVAVLAALAAKSA
jgi:hypothetical protein